jgi:hypothetical protein
MRAHPFIIVLAVTFGTGILASTPEIPKTVDVDRPIADAGAGIPS